MRTLVDHDKTAIICESESESNCYAGTPLGDPIEVGALGQALSERSSVEHAVAIGSVKSCYGHTEGSAGLTGALLAISELQHSARPPVMHLRSTNSYVEAALKDWRKTHRLSASVQRQNAPASAEHTAGTSSFGMSGINAHLVLVTKRPDLSADNKASQAWRRGRCWPVPRTHAVLQSVAPLQSGLHFACSLQTAKLAALGDVTVSLSHFQCF